jgi:hypothetical protein
VDCPKCNEKIEIPRRTAPPPIPIPAIPQVPQAPRRRLITCKDCGHKISLTATPFVTPGTYVWTWGDGADQRFTLQIGSVGVPGVPDGGSTVSLLGCALLGLAALRRKLSC